MPKIITAKRLEGETELAQTYVRSHILFPSAVLGLVMILSGIAALVYQFIADHYGTWTFLQSSGLMVAGMILGWIQTRYHRYLLREHPGFFANRMRTFSRSGLKRGKKDTSFPEVSHAGRNWVPVGYLGGFVVLVGVSALAALKGEVFYMAAFLLPWAGFFWAKMFFWRRVIPPVPRGRKS
ncbi:MAG: hypothetical protein ACREI3_04095 [Nitrospirales bacterium]